MDDEKEFSLSMLKRASRVPLFGDDVVHSFSPHGQSSLMADPLRSGILQSPVIARPE